MWEYSYDYKFLGDIYVCVCPYKIYHLSIYLDVTQMFSDDGPMTVGKVIALQNLGFMGNLICNSPLCRAQKPLLRPFSKLPQWQSTFHRQFI